MLIRASTIDNTYGYGLEMAQGIVYGDLDGQRLLWARSSARKVEKEISESDVDVDVSCSRLVPYEEHDGIPGLTIFRRGPPTWKPTSPVASIGIGPRPLMFSLYLCLFGWR